MRWMLGCTALFCGLGAATAGPIYDRKLEQAAMDAIARKIGDIRSDMVPDYVPPVSISRDMGPPSAPVKSWRILLADDATRSQTAGSIQTYAAPPGEIASPAVREGAGQRGRKVPRVLKF